MTIIEYSAILFFSIIGWELGKYLFNKINTVEYKVKNGKIKVNKYFSKNKKFQKWIKTQVIKK